MARKKMWSRPPDDENERALTPEQELLGAVLKQALRDALLSGVESREARHFLTSVEEVTGICEALNINPKWFVSKVCASYPSFYRGENDG